jgi:hypothetical protein
MALPKPMTNDPRVVEPNFTHWTNAYLVHLYRKQAIDQISQSPDFIGLVVLNCVAGNPTKEFAVLLKLCLV